MAGQPVNPSTTTRNTCPVKPGMNTAFVELGKRKKEGNIGELSRRSSAGKTKSLDSTKLRLAFEGF
jgi:hypothetical protein